MSPAQLRSSQLRTPFRGARLRPDEPTETANTENDVFDESPASTQSRVLRKRIARLARAFATTAPPDYFFCHGTAAVLWGLPLPIRVLRGILPPETRDTLRRGQGNAAMRSTGIDVGVLTPGRASRARAVRGRQLSPALATVCVRDGLLVSSPASTWAMLADVLTVDELIEVGDAIVQIPRRRGMQRGDPCDALADIEELTAAANAPYRRHAHVLRAAVEQIRIGSASPAETKVRLACVRAGLPEPELDVDVYAADGRPIGFTELAYRRFRLLIEYEGDHHRVDREQWQRDVDKHAACVDAGYEVLRLTAKHVYPSTRPAVERVRRALFRAGWQG